MQYVLKMGLLSHSSNCSRNIHTTTLTVSVDHIQPIQQILAEHQEGNFPDTGPLRDKLSGKTYIVFWKGNLLIHGFRTKCPLTVNGNATTCPCGGSQFNIGCELLLEWCMHILETVVYGEREADFSTLVPLEVQNGMWRPLASAGASNGLETRLYIQQFMIPMRRREC